MAPVHEAARGNDVEELRRLLDEDPGSIEAEEHLESPLECACVQGSVDAARLLLDRGVDANKRTGRGGTLLLTACFWGHHRVVELLLDRGADPCLRTGWTTLIQASKGAKRDRGSDHVAVIRALLKDGRVPIDARDHNGSTALWWACYFGDTERARVLLMEGLADHTIRGKEGLTPMAAAQRQGREDCMRLLQWYEGELHRAFLLTKARAVLDATHSITKAPEKAQAQTQAQAQRVREEAAPAWLRGRVVGGEALPDVEVVGQAGQQQEEEEEEEEEELCAVCGWLVSVVSEDLWLEVMEGLRYRRCLPGEEEEEEEEVEEDDDDDDNDDEEEEKDDDDDDDDDGGRSY